MTSPTSLVDSLNGTIALCESNDHGLYSYYHIFSGMESSPGVSSATSSASPSSCDGAAEVLQVPILSVRSAMKPLCQQKFCRVSIVFVSPVWSDVSSIQTVPAATLTARSNLLELLVSSLIMEFLVFRIPNWMELIAQDASP